MRERLLNIAIFNKIFNIYSDEWPKVSLAWLVRFFYRAGFVIGWTIIIGMFVSEYGIRMLPFLFGLNALLTIAGSMIFSSLLARFTKPQLMISIIFAAGLTLFTSLFFVNVNDYIFFILLVSTEAVFMMQFKMLMDGFTEELFTPLESERTFPVIEAAETIGGLIAGVTVLSLANAIDTYKFVYIWIGCLFLIVPFLLLKTAYSKENVILINKSSAAKKPEKRLKKSIGILREIRGEFSNNKYISYIGGIVLIVFFQWFLYSLIEFQYTKAVYQNVSGMVLEGGSGFEHSFIHDLGALGALFSSFALMVQLFVGSRLINYLGVMGSMILHPLVTLLSLFGLTLSFNFPIAVLAKNNFTATTIIYTNVYHSSYYAVREKFREYVREFLEGFVRPVGAFLGTLTLILLQLLFADSQLILYVNLSMIVVAILMLYISYKQQGKYTNVAIADLDKSEEREVQFNAIDILAQNGHGEAGVEKLKELLSDGRQPLSLRVKTLRALASLEDASAIEVIVASLKSKSELIHEEALNALLSYKILNKPSKHHLFLKYELLKTLKKLYRSEKDENVRMLIIELLSKLGNVSIVDFLIKTLKKSNNKLKAEAISALGKYNDESVLEFIKPYLKSKDAWVKVNAAISMYNFADYKDEDEHEIGVFLYSKRKKDVGYGLYAVGELGLKQRRKLCLDYLENRDKNLKLQAAVALAKMKDSRSIPALIDLIFDEDYEVAKKARRMMRYIDVRIYKNLDKMIKETVNRKINELIVKTRTKSLQRFEKRNLQTLKWLYSLVGEYDEVELINSMLKIS